MILLCHRGVDPALTRVMASLQQEHHQLIEERALEEARREAEEARERNVRPGKFFRLFSLPSFPASSRDGT